MPWNLRLLHKETILENFWVKGNNAVLQGESEKPYAWIIPREQSDLVAARRLLEILKSHRIEVRQLTENFTAGDQEFVAGSLVVRMDQPYRNFAKTLLEKQEWPEKSDTRPYDATTWTIGLMMGVETVAIDDAEVLQAPMKALDSEQFNGVLNGEDSAGHIVIPPQGNATLSAVLALKGEEIYITNRAFEAGGTVLSGRNPGLRRWIPG